MMADTTLDLEQAADDLLEAAGLLGRETGAYTHKQLMRKMRLEEHRVPKLDEFALPAEVADYLVESLMDELVDAARLSAMQEICYRLHASGLSVRRISATLRIKRQVIAAHLGIARRKVQRAVRQGRYAGWYEVYLSEVNRPVYRPRRR